MTKSTNNLTAKLSMSACVERGIAPASTHKARLVQLKTDDANIATRAAIAGRTGVQGHEGQPTARVRAYRLQTRLSAWLSDGATVPMILGADDPAFAGSKTARGGCFTGTAAVRAAVRKSLSGLSVPADHFVSIGADGQDVGPNDANVPLSYVVLTLKERV